MKTSTEYLRERASNTEPLAGSIPSGQELESVRRSLNLSQESLARLLDVSRLTVLRYEQGMVANPRSLGERWPRQVLAAMVTEAARERARERSDLAMRAWAG